MKKMKFGPEASGNHFLCKCIAFTFLGTFIVAFLNWFGIFGTNFKVTQACFGIVTILAILGLAVAFLLKFEAKWMKYYLMVIISLMTLTLTSCLTFHATIIFIFPIVYCTVFRNNQFIIFTYCISVVFMFISLYVGYYYGVCDLNIIFLPVNGIKDTVDASGNVTGSDMILDGTWWKLLLYFGIPRLLILTVFTPICISIMNRIARLSDSAVRFEYLATHDGMTGIFNKRFYLQKVEEQYKKEIQIGVIFIDANNLKLINDTLGHEHGDEFILAISRAIESVSSDTIHGYRVGGDEFVVVVLNPTMDRLLSLKQNIEANVELLERDSVIPFGISSGHALGEGSDYDTLIKEAEQLMYKNKEANKRR